MYLVIDNYDSFTYNIVQYLAELTDEAVRVFRNDAVTIDDIRSMHPDGIIISPGPGRPEDAGISVEAVREFAGKIPILGVCLGHQAIAYAYGCPIVRSRHIMHGKLDTVSTDGRGLFRSIPRKTVFTRYHSLAADRTALTDHPELEVTARAADGEIMGIRHRVHTVEGVQFHPESIASEEGKKVLKNFLNYSREPFDVSFYLNRVIGGGSLERKDAADFMDELTEGNLNNSQIAAFLTALNAKGFTAEEIAGCAEILRRKRVPFVSDRPLLDTCGTGGDGLGTFNFSSCAALVCAACGASVAKHGNRAVSSKSGSADFYQSLGISISLKPERAQELLQQTSFAFLFAPHYHSAMRFAGPVRKELGMKTIMNVLGPLANPGESEYQMLGVYDKALMERIAEAGAALGMKRVMTVHGEDGEDEMSVTGPTFCCLITTDAGKASGSIEAAGKIKTAGTAEKAGTAETSKEFFTIAPEDFGLRRFPAEAVRGGSPEENAAVARLIFGYTVEETLIAAGADPDDADGLAGFVRELNDEVLQAVKTSVILNSGAALFVAEAAESIAEGVKLAQKALENGEVRRKMEQISAVSQKLAAAAVTAEG